MDETRAEDKSNGEGAPKPARCRSAGSNPCAPAKTFDKGGTLESGYYLDVTNDIQKYTKKVISNF